MPRQYRGVALDSPGLFFLGQDFMYAVTSATLPGECRDARYLAGKIPLPVSREAVASPV
jgi:putative flavoprotein involved in K+ transport